jgi:thiol-disulfide isomerase/thioredoxin
MPRGTAHWPQKDSLPGKLVGASRETVSWDTEKAAGVLELEQTALKLLQIKGGKIKPSEAGCWRVHTTNGDALFADQISLQGTELQLSSRSHGLVKLPLASLQGMQRTGASAAVIHTGPVGLANWSGGPALMLHAGGIGQRNTEGSFRLKLDATTPLPERVRVDFTLQSMGSMDFQLQLNPPGTEGPVVDVWGSQLILCASKLRPTVFSLAKELDMKQPSAQLSLSLLWDRATRTAQLWSQSGTLLAKLQNVGELPPPGLTLTKAPAMLQVLPRSPELLLKELHILRWDGQPLLPLDPDKASLLTTDGRWISGTAQLSSAGITVGHQALTPWEQVHHFQQPLQRAASSPEGLYGEDGTIIRGRLTGMDGRALLMQPPWSAQPLRCELRASQLLHLPTQQQPPLAVHMDHFQGGVYDHHGSLEPVSHSEPHWRFIGARNTIPLSKMVSAGKDWFLQRATSLPHSSSSGQALLIGRTGELIRADLRSMDEHTVSYRTSTSHQGLIAPQKLRAITFTPHQIDPQGLRDKGWHCSTTSSPEEENAEENAAPQADKKPITTLQLGKTPREDSITLQEGYKLTHPTLCNAREIRFRLKTEDSITASLHLLLFTETDQASENNPLSIIISRSADTVFVMQDEDGGRQHLRLPKDQPVNIRIRMEEKVSVYVNEAQLFSMEHEANTQQGILFTSTSLWGSPIHPIQLSDFSIQMRPEDVPPILLPETNKVEALTLPRRKRDTLPQNLLLSPTGDLLRGDALLATQHTLRWRSGLEELDLPLTRIQHLLWLDAPDSPAPAPLPRTWVALRDQSQVAVQIQQLRDGEIIGSSDTFGPLHLPLSEVVSLSSGTTPRGTGHESYLQWQLSHAQEPVLPEKGSSSPLVGKTAPDIDLAWLEGAGRMKLSDFKGQVLILDFWASWCGPCLAALPEALQVMEGYKDQPIQFIGINQGEAPAEVKRFLERRSWKLRVALDTDGTASTAYAVDGIPHTVLIGKDGLVQWVSTGFSKDSPAALKTAIDTALAK